MGQPLFYWNKSHFIENYMLFKTIFNNQDFASAMD